MATTAAEDETGPKKRSALEVLIFRLLLLGLLVSAALLVGLFCYNVAGKKTETTRAAAKELAAAQSLSRSLSASIIDPDAPIYVVTPTHQSVYQLPHLTRQLWTLATVPNVIWLLIQDDEDIDPYIDSYLNEQLYTMGRMSFYNQSTLQVVYFGRGPLDNDEGLRDCRGRLGRNAAMRELYARSAFPDLAAQARKRASISNFFVQGAAHKLVTMSPAAPTSAHTFPKGWVYFLDDDNTVSPALFTEIRRIRRVGVWPVGNMVDVLTSSPMVYTNGSVAAFLDRHVQRNYKVDMAGFGLNLEWMYARAVEKEMPFDDYWQLKECSIGDLETLLLERAVDSKSDMEPLADRCSKVLVWHTQTKKIPAARVGYRQWLYRHRDIYVNALPLMREIDHHGLSSYDLAARLPLLHGVETVSPSSQTDSSIGEATSLRGRSYTNDREDEDDDRALYVLEGRTSRFLSRKGHRRRGVIKGQSS